MLKCENTKFRILAFFLCETRNPRNTKSRVFLLFFIKCENAQFHIFALFLCIIRNPQNTKLRVFALCGILRISYFALCALRVKCENVLHISCKKAMRNRRNNAKINVIFALFAYSRKRDCGILWKH